MWAVKTAFRQARASFWRWTTRTESELRLAGASPQSILLILGAPLTQDFHAETAAQACLKELRECPTCAVARCRELLASYGQQVTVVRRKAYWPGMAEARITIDLLLRVRLASGRACPSDNAVARAKQDAAETMYGRRRLAS